MSHLLKNELLEIKVDLPSEGYSSTRFDYTGKVIEVKFKGIPVAGTEQLNNPNHDDLGRGFYNEFGIDSALGFDEANDGDWFHKIGIGLLSKTGQQYQFNKTYEVRLAKFSTQTEAHKIMTSCKSELVNGYSYFLRKEMILYETSFEINYFLENTGTKNIHTTEYNHNFITINNELMGSSYELRFPFELKTESFEEFVNPENCVTFHPNSISFNKNPNEQFFFSEMNGKFGVPAHWELSNYQHKIGISETGSFYTKKVNLWGWQHVISPELFFEINCEPGNTTAWSRTYNFFSLP